MTDAQSNSGKYFLSHAGVDNDAALRLARGLRDAGVPVWCDQDDLTLGFGWPSQLNEALELAIGGLVLVPDAKHDMGHWQRAEVDALLKRQARRRGNFPIIVLRHPGQPWPEHLLLGRLHGLELPEGQDDGRGYSKAQHIEIAQKIRQLSAAPNDRTQHADVVRPAECPLPDLASFDHTNAEFFFGRDAEVSRLCDALAGRGDDSSGAKYLVLHGPPGSGKSSVVKAGLVPALQRGLVDRNCPRWSVAIFQPGGDPILELATALSTTIAGTRGRHEPAWAIEVLDKRLRASEKALAGIVRQFILPTPLRHGGAFLLVIDQFEELFTIVKRPTQDLRLMDRLLRHFLDDHGRSMRLVVTVRSEFLPAFPAERLPRMARLANRSDDRRVGVTIELPSMSPDGMREAIECPPQRCGLTVEAGLADRIIQDAASFGAPLTMLGHVLHELWPPAKEDSLTHARYKAVGRLAGAVTRSAERVLDSLGEASGRAMSLLVELVRIDPRAGFTRNALTHEQALSVLRRPQHTDADGANGATPMDDDASGILARLSGGRDRNDLSAQPWPTLVSVGPRRAHEAPATDGRQPNSGAGGDEVEALGERAADDMRSEAAKANLRVDLVHEDLIRWWPKLLAAVQAQRTRLESRDHLLDLAHRWDKDGRTDRFVGSLLAELATFEQALDHSPALRTPLIEAFMGRARTLERRRTAEEASRRAHEEDLRVQAEVARISRGKWRVRAWRYAAAALAFLVATLTAIYYWQGERSARQQLAQSSAAALAREKDNREREIALEQANRIRSVAFEQAGRAIALAQSIGREREALELVVSAWQAVEDDPGAHRSSILDAAALDVDRAVRRSWPLAGRCRVAALSSDGTRVAAACEGDIGRLFDVATGAAIATLGGHDDVIRAVAFSADGAFVATASDDGTVRIWDGRSGRPIRPLPPRRRQVTCVAFSMEDGIRLAAGCDDNTVQLWNANTGTLIRLLDAHRDVIKHVVFSRDGRRLLTTSRDGTALVWDGETGDPIAPLGPAGQGKWVTHASFSSDGARVVTAGHAGATVWIASTGERVTPLVGHKGAVNTAEFSPDDTRILTAGEDGTARMWDAATGAELARMDDHDAAVRQATYVLDGSRVLTASADGTARLWDARDGRHLRAYEDHGSALRRAIASSDGSIVLTVGEDETARCWSVDPGSPLATLARHRTAVNDVSFSPDGRRVVTAGSDGDAYVWDVGTGRMVAPLYGHIGSVRRAEFSPNGTRVVTAGDDTTARTWDAASGIELQPLGGHGGEVLHATFSPDGRRVATGSRDGAVRLFDAETGGTVWEFLGHAKEVSSVRFSFDGARLAAASKPCAAWLLDAATGRCISALDHPDQQWVWSAEFSPDARRIVTGCSDKSARLWNGVTGDFQVELAGHGDVVMFATFSPDGHWVATAGRDRRARLWNPATGEHVAALAGHIGPVVSASFSRDSARLVTAGSDGTARLWDVGSRTLVTTFQGHGNRLNRAVLSPCGSARVATASDDGTVCIWQADANAAMTELCARLRAQPEFANLAGPMRLFVERHAIGASAAAPSTR